MATILRRVPLFAALPLTALLAFEEKPAPRFYKDDPIHVVPAPAPVGDVRTRKVDALYDLMHQSARAHPRPAQPALAVNTLGEVPDSAWYTNRHGMRRMSREELRRGPGDANAPVAPLRVIGGKTEGITPGFRLKDAKGRLYFVKPDPPANPEMATAAEMIGSRFFYALGYNTPENYLLRVRPSDLKIDDEATVTGISGRPRRMNRSDLNEIFLRSARSQDGTVRLLASLKVEGRPIGPFKYEGMRADDPNDTVPHERRRDLRGLFVFAAWVNHTDTKAQNTLDTVVEENGVRYIRHHLIDFGAILGSASDMPKPARTGNGYVLPTAREALMKMATLGLYSPAWERARYPEFKEVGRFEAEAFDPEEWKSNYPNPAFLSRLADDEFWAAKQVVRFTDDDVRAIVETGEYSDPKVTEYIVNTLAKRRDAIGKAFLGKMLALDRFRVEDNELRFDDLAPKGPYQVMWSQYDNRADRHTRASGDSFRLPVEWHAAAAGAYFAAHIGCGGTDERQVTVYLRKGDGVVGVDRHVPTDSQLALARHYHGGDETPQQ